MARNKGIQKRLNKSIKHKEQKKLDTKLTQSLNPNNKTHKTKSHESQWTGLKGFYHKNLKTLMIIPILLLVLGIAQLGYQYSTTGEFFLKDVSLAGGLSATIQPGKIIDVADLETYLENKFGAKETSVRELKNRGIQAGVIIEASKDIPEKDLMTTLQEKIGTLEKNQYSIEITGSALGESFFKQLLQALLLAFLFMGVVVLIYFRTLIPSGAVVLCALSDIIETLAIVNLLGIKLSAAGIAAFLMLIGYSVDTDILLSTRVLKNKEGTVFSRLFGAMKPGMIMSFTTLTVVSVGFFFSQSETLKQIMTIIFIGLLLDLVNTWIQNSGIVALYAQKRESLGKK